MKRIPDGSVDMILCDLPYGTTRNEWDSVIPLDKLWAQYNRIIKSNGAIVLTAQDKFTARLMMSNEEMHRYNLIWDKILSSGFLNANKMPLRSHEDILVFYKSSPTYNPQKNRGRQNHSKGIGTAGINNNYGHFEIVDNREKLGDMKHPKSIITFSKPHPSVTSHPTQKPVELFKYLIKTYTNEGETVLDNCMGSGTTAVACLDTKRNYMGFELDETYYKKSLERIKNHTTQTELFDYI